MKVKIYSLRTQKMELDRRIMEKQSTIDSLKDEYRALESAITEKQNEIELLRGKETDPEKESPQVVSLTESLKQKEAEIEDLKHRLEYPVKVWSVSTDDPSSPPMNLTVNGSIRVQAKANIVKSAEQGEQLLESILYKGGENLTRSEDRSKLELNNLGETDRTERVEDGAGNNEGDTDRREMMGEQTQKQEKLQDESISGGHAIEEVQGIKHEDSLDGGDFGLKNDNDTEVFDELKNSQEHDDQELLKIHEAGTKLEETGNSSIGKSSSMRGKHGHAKTKGKRWRMLVKSRYDGHSVRDETVSMRSRKFFIDDQDVFKSRNEGTASDKGKMEREGGEIRVNDPMEVRKEDNVSDEKLMEPQNLEHSNYLENRVVNADTNHRVANRREILANPRNSLNDDVQLLKTGSTNDEASNEPIDARKHKVDEGRQSEEREASSIQKQTSRALDKVDNVSERVRVNNTNPVLEDLVVANVGESEKK